MEAILYISTRKPRRFAPGKPAMKSKMNNIADTPHVHDFKFVGPCLWLFSDLNVPDTQCLSLPDNQLLADDPYRLFEAKVALLSWLTLANLQKKS